jgi:serine/threonine protein kinase
MGKYRLTSVLGSGGFATVYAARHVDLDSLRYAVKVLKSVHLDDTDVLDRFEREAKTVATLRSRYTVRVVDVGVSDDGRPCIVMEYVAGRPLGDVLATLGRLSPLQAAHIAMGVLRSLDEAHGRSIVHRDLKPINALYCPCVTSVACSRSAPVSVLECCV